jgi:hypothetical protein
MTNKTNIYSAILLLFCVNLYSQQRIITGRVIDEDEQPLPGVTILIDNNVYANTDFNGLFIIEIDSSLDKYLKFSFVGYETKVIEIEDSLSTPLLIKLFSNADPYSHPTPTPARVIQPIGFTAGWSADFVYTNYSMFESILGSFNDSILESSSIGVNYFELGPELNRLYARIGFGYSLNSDRDYNDSVDLEVNTSLYGFSIGYDLIDSRRFLFSPFLSIKLNRYRLLNSNNDRKITLTSYIEERSLDLRFNQVTGFAGAYLAYKIKPKYYYPADNISVGAYAGYIFKMNEKPWIYTRNNRITSNEQIRIKNYSFGIQVLFNIE